MKKYFENEQTNQLFLRWINSFPESFHPFDKERFYDFLLCSLKNNEELTEEILTEVLSDKKKWIESSRKNFVENIMIEYYKLIEFWNFCKKHDN